MKWKDKHVINSILNSEMKYFCPEITRVGIAQNKLVSCPCSSVLQAITAYQYFPIMFCSFNHKSYRKVSSFVSKLINNRSLVLYLSLSLPESLTHSLTHSINQPTNHSVSQPIRQLATGRRYFYHDCYIFVYRKL